MKKYIIIGIIIGIIVSLGHNVYAQSAPFLSRQIGSSPVNNRVLLTDGTNSTWVATSSLGITGGGITSLNSQTNSSQSFATTTSGTKFTISSSGGVHTFNFPTSPTFSTTTTSALIAHEIFADGSDGIIFKAANGTQVANFGSANTANATFNGGVNVTNNLAVDTNVLYVDSTNNRVGIGTSTPSSTLDIQGTGGTNPFTIASSTGNALVLVTQNGNVGIGVTNPNALLTVASTGEGTYNAPNFGSSNIGAINIRAGTSNRRNGITFSSAGNTDAQAGIYFHQDNTNGTYMYFATTNNYSTGPQARLTILSDGSVGIGTVSPGAKLAVNGGMLLGAANSQRSFYSNVYLVPTATNVNITLNESSAVLVNGWNYRIRLATASTGTNTGAEYIVYQTAAGTWEAKLVSANGIIANHPLLGVSGSNVYVFHNHASQYYITTFVEGWYTNNNALTASTFFGLDGALTNIGGNIGIGTTSPSSTLYIQGTGGTNPFTVASSTGTSLLTVTQAGNVGIGTTTPSNKLDVIGSAYFGGAVTTTGTITAVTTVGTELMFTGGGSASIYQSVLAGGLFLNSNTGAISLGANGSGSQQLNIISSGNVGIGSTSPTARLTVVGTSSSPTTDLLNIASSTNASVLIVKADGSVGIGSSTPAGKLGVVGSVFLNGLSTGTTGNAVCINANKEIVDAGGTTCTTSSERFKSNIDDLKNSLNIVTKMRPVSFTRNEPSQSQPDGKEIGFIAEEVNEIDKRLVEYEADGITPRGVNYQAYTAHLTGAIQALNEKIDNLDPLVANTKKKTTDNAQWIIIVILLGFVIRQQLQINKLK